MSSLWYRRLASSVAVALVTATLAGCVVVPERPYGYHGYYHGYYYR